MWKLWFTVPLPRVRFVFLKTLDSSVPLGRKLRKKPLIVNILSLVSSTSKYLFLRSLDTSPGEFIIRVTNRHVWIYKGVTEFLLLMIFKNFVYFLDVQRFMNLCNLKTCCYHFSRGTFGTHKLTLGSFFRVIFIPIRSVED